MSGLQVKTRIELFWAPVADRTRKRLKATFPVLVLVVAMRVGGLSLIMGVVKEVLSGHLRLACTQFVHGSKVPEQDESNSQAQRNSGGIMSDTRHLHL